MSMWRYIEGSEHVQVVPKTLDESTSLFCTSLFLENFWHASLGINQSSTHKDGVFYEHLNLMIKKSHVEINSNKVNMDIN